MSNSVCRLYFYRNRTELKPTVVAEWAKALKDSWSQSSQVCIPLGTRNAHVKCVHNGNAHALTSGTCGVSMTSVPLHPSKPKPLILPTGGHLNNFLIKKKECDANDLNMIQCVIKLCGWASGGDVF